MPSPGDVLAGRYELVQQIGAGGMATVWRARDRRLGRTVAVKLLRPELAQDEDFARRFEFEARHAASLAHQNVAGVYDTDVDGDRRFIVMELVDGPTVADVIAQQGPIDPPVAVRIAAGAARALAAAHRRGLIHRDVKPANLLIGRDGRVRLADFGIARALTTSRVTTPGTVLGSIPYLSPEQARGDEATAAGDIFSLGVVLFEMLTGRLPWDADTPAAMATIRLQEPAPPPSAVLHSLPRGLDAIVGRALAIDPAKRYASARNFADALDAWNRRNRHADREALLGQTTALAAQVAPAAAMAGTARPNPWASPRLQPGGTRRGGPATPLPAGGVRAERVPRERPARERDGRLPVLLALGTLALVGLIGAAVLFGGGGAASPTPVIVAGGGASQSAVAVVTPAPSASPVVTPTPSPTPQPTQPPTPRPTPRPTPSPAPPATPRPVITPEPQLSAPAAAVVNFYNAVVAHDWATATALWSPSMQQRYPPQEWLIDRFKRTTRIDITNLRTLSVNESAGTARVAVSLIEYRTVEPSPRTFVGSWDLVRIDGRWLLNAPHF